MHDADVSKTGNSIGVGDITFFGQYRFLKSTKHNLQAALLAGYNYLMTVKNTTEKATFAAGCFWGIETAFSKINGVISTVVGYTGGHFFKNPTYKDVCSGTTGHAEAVLIEYDPTVITYNELLKVFWEIHDPSTFNRQGPDIGTQYRSAVFFHNSEQEKIAKESKKNLENSKVHKSEIVTEIIPAQDFWKAEEYHQKYFEKQKRCIL